MDAPRPARPSEPAVVDFAGLRLSVSAVARRLGIAPATLRTWDRRYGVGPTGHSSGSHRRYAPGDVARLELMKRALIDGASPAEAARLALTATAPDGPGPTALVLPPVPDQDHEPTPAVELLAGAPRPELEVPVVVGTVLRLPGVGRRARGLARAMLALDGDTAMRLLHSSVQEIGLVRTWDEVARPVLGSVADRWARTGAGVEVEHLLSEVLTTVVARVVHDADEPVSVRPVLLGSMPGERHALPLRVLAATLAQRGVGTSLLGADLPRTALIAAIERTAPTAVFLWSQIAGSADPELVSQLPRTRPRTRCYVGGPGWDVHRLPASVVHLGSLGEAGNVLTATAGL